MHCVSPFFLTEGGVVAGDGGVPAVGVTVVEVVVGPAVVPP